MGPLISGSTLQLALPHSGQECETQLAVNSLSSCAGVKEAVMDFTFGPSDEGEGPVEEPVAKPCSACSVPVKAHLQRECSWSFSTVNYSLRKPKLIKDANKVQRAGRPVETLAISDRFVTFASGFGGGAFLPGAVENCQGENERLRLERCWCQTTLRSGERSARSTAVRSTATAMQRRGRG